MTRSSYFRALVGRPDRGTATLRPLHRPLWGVTGAGANTQSAGSAGLHDADHVPDARRADSAKALLRADHPRPAEQRVVADEPGRAVPIERSPVLAAPPDQRTRVPSLHPQQSEMSEMREE